jgi:hypothetical protein
LFNKLKTTSLPAPEIPDFISDLSQQIEDLKQLKQIPLTILENIQSKQG